MRNIEGGRPLLVRDGLAPMTHLHAPGLQKAVGDPTVEPGAEERAVLGKDIHPARAPVADVVHLLLGHLHGQAAVGLVIALQAQREQVAFVVQPGDVMLGSLGTQSRVAALSVVLIGRGKLVIEPPGQPETGVFRKSKLERQARIDDGLPGQRVIISPHAECRDDPPRRLPFELGVGPVRVAA